MELAELRGRITPEEGERLRSLSSVIPASSHIVELGANTGKATCYMAVGSKEGNRAKVWAIDMWNPRTERSDIDKDPNIPKIFARQISAMKVKTVVISVREDTKTYGIKWPEYKDVGLLYIDGDNSFIGPQENFDAWNAHIKSGGYVVIRDFYPARDENGRRPHRPVYNTVHAIKISGEWTDFEIAGTLFIARKK